MTSFTALTMAMLISHVLLASSIKLKQGDGISQPLLWPPVDSEQDDSMSLIPPENATLEPLNQFNEVESVEGLECGRGFNCGITTGETLEPMSVNCPDGVKWFARNAIFIRGRHGKNAIYCSVPKVGTSYIFGVLSDLHLAVRGGKRNAGFEAVHELISKNTTSGNEELCKAFSFIMVRNPWERIASGYVDKVLTKEVFTNPPSFNNFMHMLQGVKDPSQINQHFRPASFTCHTTGEHSMNYDLKFKIESNPRKHLEDIFMNRLALPKSQVLKVLDKWESDKHSTASKGWAEIDKSIDSGLSRVHYYMRQTDPSIVEKVYKDDIEFGNYNWAQTGK